jgi:hypothetical protein
MKATYSQTVDRGGNRFWGNDALECDRRELEKPSGFEGVSPSPHKPDPGHDGTEQGTPRSPTRGCLRGKFR